MGVEKQISLFANEKALRTRKAFCVFGSCKLCVGSCVRLFARQGNVHGNDGIFVDVLRRDREVGYIAPCGNGELD